MLAVSMYSVADSLLAKAGDTSELLRDMLACFALLEDDVRTTVMGDGKMPLAITQADAVRGEWESASSNLRRVMHDRKLDSSDCKTLCQMAERLSGRYSTILQLCRT